MYNSIALGALALAQAAIIQPAAPVATIAPASPQAVIIAPPTESVLRAGTEAGTVRVIAKAEGLKPAEIVIPVAMPKAPAGGLSLDFPEAHQRGSLTRGPTLSTPSYRVTRATYVPAQVVAGDNEADAGKSIDDNELSRWSSGGKADTAWIEYRFDESVTLSEVELKLVGWRTRAYPLRIVLDGKTVWEGTSEKSLGYVGIPFAPATGRVLRIVQTGPSADRDAFGNIVELSTARQAGDTGANEVSPGWRLGIVEADFHGPVSGRGKQR